MGTELASRTRGVEPARRRPAAAVVPAVGWLVTMKALQVGGLSVVVSVVSNHTCDRDRGLVSVRNISTLLGTSLPKVQRKASRVFCRAHEDTSSASKLAVAKGQAGGARDSQQAKHAPQVHSGGTAAWTRQVTWLHTGSRSGADLLVGALAGLDGGLSVLHKDGVCARQHIPFRRHEPVQTLGHKGRGVSAIHSPQCVSQELGEAKVRVTLGSQDWVFSAGENMCQV